MSNILSTDLALETFAQIVDGRPTFDVYQEFYDWDMAELCKKTEPSQIARQIVQGHRETFSIGIAQIDAKVPIHLLCTYGNQGQQEAKVIQVAQAYQNASEGSREFILRLLEAVAIICHDIAVNLYIKYEGGINKPAPPPASPRKLPFGIVLPPIPPAPSEFFHPYYQNWEQYPNGIPDMAGYWAEMRIFGGVVLFDRGESGTEVDIASYPFPPLSISPLTAPQCKNVFLHLTGRYKIFQMSDAQIQQYANFMLSDPSSSKDRDLSQGLRFKAEKWAYRVDPYDAMDLHIYRNRWERIIPEERPRQSCIVRGEDEPGLAEAYADLDKRHRERWGL